MSEIPPPITAGQLRQLLGALPDDAPVLLEIADDELGEMTHKLHYAAMKFVRCDDIERQDFDISYFDNEMPESRLALILSDEVAAKDYVCEHVGPGVFFSRPMKRIEAGRGPIPVYASGDATGDVPGEE